MGVAGVDANLNSCVETPLACSAVTQSIRLKARQQEEATGREIL